MTVVAGSFVYDVADPLQPRRVCRGTNTVVHVLDSNAIAYTRVAAGHVVIVRRDIATGAESQVAQLRTKADPYYYYGPAIWTWDGSLEVYATAGIPNANGRWVESVHLRSGVADTVLFTIDAGPGGLESRWSPRPILAFSPDHAYLAVSDFGFAIYGNNIRIFSVADRRQRFVTAASSSGGTWIANDRFVWATMSGALTEWTPSTGSKLLRSEWWYGATSTADGRWLAGTIFTRLGVDRYDNSKLRTLIVPVGGGATFTTGIGSSPGFITSSVLWYAEEGPCAASGSCGMDVTAPTGTIRAFDITNGTDRIVTFRSGETPKTAEGFTVCCMVSG